MVSPSKQIFKCFGCGKGGNAITFVKEFERIDFMDAVKMLAKDGNIDLKKYEFDEKKMAEFADEKETIKNLHKVAQKYFVEELKKNSFALDYLHTKRKLDDDTIEQFGIGYAPDNHYWLISYLKSKWYKENEIIASSLGKKWQSSDLFSFFRNRITFPIYDQMNNVIAFTARIINPDDKPKYLNSSEHIAFEKSKILYWLNIAKQHIKEHNKILIVEWQMDVIATFRLGFPIGVATSGTALTEEHLKTIKRFTENVYFLFDKDRAGEEASIRWLKVAYWQNIFPKILSNLPDWCKDVDDLANMSDGKNIFVKCFDESKDGFLTVFERLIQSSDLSSPVDKQKLFNKMFEMIVVIENTTIQAHYLGVLADKFGITYKVLEAQYINFVKSQWKFVNKQRKEEVKSHLYQPDREVIFASIFFDGFIEKIFSNIEIVKPLIESFFLIQENIPETLIWKISNSSLTDGEKQSLQEWQLWRENNLHGISDEQEKLNQIKKIIWKTLQDYIKQILKISKISNEEKQKILTLSKRI